MAGVSVAQANNITVEAGSNDVVILRNLRLDGLLGNGSNSNNAGVNGIFLLSGTFLSVENCTISGYTSTGINVNTEDTATLNVMNSTITNVTNGIYLQSDGGTVYGEMDHTTIQKTSSIGIEAFGSVVFTVTNSNILNAAFSGVYLGVGGTVLNIDSSSVSSNNTGFTTTGGLIRISRNVIYDNNVNYAISGGGTIATTGDNIVAVNGTAVPNGSVTVE